MKILHIITRLIVGGAQENTLLTCEGLHARGHEVTLLTGPSPGPEGTLLARAQSGGYQVIVTPHLVRNPHPYHDLTAYRQIKRIVRETRPDIVHTHSSKAGILGRTAAWNAFNQKSKIKHQKFPQILHTIHGLPFHPYQSPIARLAWITLERHAARRCHAIICVADAMTRQALAAKVGHPEMFTTIYSAMDTAPFLSPPTTRDQIRQQLNIPPTALVYGTIARLQPLKGHDDLLATAATLFEKVPDAHLLWIGDGIFRRRIEQSLRDKGWSSRITLTGLVPPAEIPRLLPAMDVLVHPSYREGLARALPQALLAGIPIISYDCDGAAEVCLDPATHPQNSTGYLIPTGNAQALCEAMIRIAQNPTQAQQMGQRGRELCKTRFAADTMINAIEETYLGSFEDHSMTIMNDDDQKPEVGADFTIWGDALEFEVIEQNLSLKADRTWRAGESLSNSLIKTTQDGWRISTGYLQTWYAEQVIALLLSRLEPAQESLSLLRRKMSIICKLELIISGCNGKFPSVYLPPELLAKITALHCVFDVDLYA